MKRIRFSLLAFSLGAVLSSCGPQTTGGLHAWIDAPLDGTVLPVNVAVTVVSHASAPADISRVELDVNTSVVSTDTVPQSGQTYVLMSQQWTPSAPGTYQLRVRAQTHGGEWSDYAVVTVTVQGGATSTPTPPAQGAIAVPAGPSLTPSPASAAPTFTLSENAFCRKGPDISFTDVTAIPKGDTVDIEGVSQDGFWYFVLWQQFNVKCWVAAHAGQPSGNVRGLVVLVSPDTPTPTEVKPVPEPTGYKP